MMNTLYFMLRGRLKNSKLVQKSGGFTLIELLIALVIAFIIITPLLTFMISILNTDQQEQAKANTEDDIQAAANYIARDLQQAIYIYDSTGINAIKPKLRYLTTDTTKTPILVFWKRDLVSNVVPSATSGSNDDTFVYSLVTYYLDTSSDSNWSSAARITRWQIKDGVESSSSSAVTCTGFSKKYVSGYCPDKGFAPFNDYFDEGNSLSAGMQKWKTTASSTNPNADVANTTATTYDTNANVLIDAVDQSTSSPPAATCPADVTDPNDSTKYIVQWSIVQPTSMTGFYVCVDTISDSTAQIFIRGNALARFKKNASQIIYSDSKKSYFPSTNVRVQGRGYLYK